MIKLLLVDDQPSGLQGLRMQFALEPDFDVIGEAADGAEAVRMAHALHPDVIVMDTRMPIMDGIQATAMLRQDTPDIRVVILSLHDDAHTRALARSAGAAAFVAKHEPSEVLFAAVRGASVSC